MSIRDKFTKLVDAGKELGSAVVEEAREALSQPTPTPATVTHTPSRWEPAASAPRDRWVLVRGTTVTQGSETYLLKARHTSGSWWSLDQLGASKMARAPDEWTEIPR